MMKNIIETAKKGFSTIRISFLERMLLVAISELSNKVDAVNAHIEGIMEGNERVCSNVECAKEFFTKKYICDVCKS